VLLGGPMRKPERGTERNWLVGLVLAACVAAGCGGARANYVVLHDFCSQTNCADGGSPVAPLVRDANGNLFGTTVIGGAHGEGTIFELAAVAGHPEEFKYRVLYDFCTLANCADGGPSRAPLVVDRAGDLYGVANGGGLNNGGDIFELVRHPKTHSWTQKVLYAFCALANCADGREADSVAGLAYAGAASGQAYDGISPLFGTTDGGGAGTEQVGVVYELSRSAAHWRETVLHSFCSHYTQARGCIDGSQPMGSPVVAASGALFGTTYTGGTTGSGEDIEAGGTVYSLTPDSHGTWTHRVLYDFCAVNTIDPKTHRVFCQDGQFVGPTLAIDPSSNLFGFTYDGGAQCLPKPGICDGLVFGMGAGGGETTMYSFCPTRKCGGGGAPAGYGLAFDTASGALYGTDAGWGANGFGTVFSLAGGTFGALYSFCATSGCSDGDAPNGVVTDGAGHLFGTTQNGGSAGRGVAFELVR